MNSLAVIYHSTQGHTEHIASRVVDGARCVPNTEVDLLRAEDMTKVPDQLIRYDGFILGSPTYLGGVRPLQELHGCDRAAVAPTTNNNSKAGWPLVSRCRRCRPATSSRH